ncbi:MAG TPA: nucleotidyltransferase family protein [Candidatus Bathyarchaeia archaeon]|jgi:CTP:molybdopterin cytidylyltransferase MocA|nr:nucleotidyltransferase family protein [Candidatus Bathyarchaeia archaeon]
MKVAAVVLAAGAGSRFGGGKLRANLGGRPILGHVVEAARLAGLEPIVVVVPPTGELDDLDLGAVRRVTNETPQEGLSSSVRIGLRELQDDDDVAAAVILPGDQPLVRPEVIQALLAASDKSPTTPFVVPRYATDGAPNPVLARRSIWRLADELAGDRGFGPVLETHKELIRFVAVPGSNPDIDTRADLERLAEAGGPAADVS